MRSLTTNFNTLGNEITLATYSCKTILVRIPDGNTGIGAHMLNRKYDLPKAFVFRSKAVDNFKFILKIVLENCRLSDFRWGSDKLKLGATWAVGHTRSLERLVSVPAVFQKKRSVPASCQLAWRPRVIFRLDLSKNFKNKIRSVVS